MELQWPLIVFTTLVAWSAGLFGTQALMAAFGVGKKAQVPAWIASAVLLAVGGIAVFFHLEHWERIFNGFGHITSGITLEFIGCIVFAVVLVLAVLGSFVSFPAGWAGSVLSFLCSPVVLVVAAGVAGLCIRAARGGLRP